MTMRAEVWVMFGLEADRSVCCGVMPIGRDAPGNVQCARLAGCDRMVSPRLRAAVIVLTFG